ncbi:MAG: 50S ribosome-binding GTPase, partial [Planctomycetaceae bacterium]|nr:50S ribosome-binding GTPase [Planctomycetaceae bacterium]
APVASLLYRMTMFAANPASGVVRELGSYAQGELLQESKLDFQQWLLQVAIKKAGFYAIELYSGHLDLRELEPGELTSPQTEREAQQAAADTALAKQAPLRVLVLGQAKAGKSSLINELFGELQAADDVVPRTRSLTPYLLKRDDEWSALIFDSAGYSEGLSDADVLKDLSREAANADLLLWVCSAVSPAREPDRRLMHDLRQSIEADPNREFPPILVAVTHIDQLRPLREWSPPYDLRDESREKSRNIRAALQAVADDLRIPLERAIPVCLKPGDSYNVEDGLLSAMLAILPSARRLQCQRSLRERHNSEKWQLLWGQAREAGRILLDVIQGKSSPPSG